MGTQQRDQSLGREIFSRQGLVYVGCPCIPPWTLAVAGAATSTLRVQPQSL